MKEVNVDLYEFLSNHETGICSRGNDIEAWVHISFFDIQEFINIIGCGWFGEGGVDCKLQEDNICIDIIDFIEGEGHLLSSYKNCFNQNDYEEYEEQILKMEED